MAATFSLQALFVKCRQEMDSLVHTLHTSEDEAEWTSLLNDIEVALKESRWHVLHILKSAILNMESVSGLKNLMQLFIMRLSDLITEDNVLENESFATECLVLLKDFWALSSTQHHSINKQAFGGYSVVLYDVLPSLASLYIDLFVASNRSKKKTQILSKRLYGWLNMDLNERCLKTSLLEVSNYSSQTATFILPLLRKILLPSPPKKSFMDYLLHFLVLRRWALVSKDLADVVQVNLNVKAPKNFLNWLSERWHQASEHIPQDKSLKGQRVSELMCSLDKEAVEELIDVFSQCLLSGEKQAVEAVTPIEDSTEVADLFVIDKSGSGPDGPPQKKQKFEESTDFLQPSKTSGYKVKSCEKESLEDFVMSHPEINETSNINTEDSQLVEDFSDGLVVGRTAGKTKQVIKNSGGKVEVENMNEREEEEEVTMEVDESENYETDNGDDDISSMESSNEDVDEKDEHHVDNDDVVKNIHSVEEDESNGLYSSSHEDDEGHDGKSDEDDDDVKVVGGKSTDTSTFFPKCVKDPALSYFVNATPNKKNISKATEVQVIEGMEIQTFESMESVLDMKQKSEGRTDADKLVDDAQPVNHRLRSESESSHSKMSANSSLSRPLSARRNGNVKESVTDTLRQKQAHVNSEQEHEKKEISSPKKKTELRANSPRMKSNAIATSPQRKLEIESATETTTSLLEDSEVEQNTDKRPTVTEHQVGCVLSQIRSSLSDKVSEKELTPTSTRYSARLRTKSESSDIQSDTGLKKTARNRRQTLIGIKSKAEPTISNSNIHGSAKILGDWLRKMPANDNVELVQSAQSSSSDNEITFRKTPKTYTSLTKKPAESSKRMLIESKVENSDLSEGNKKRSPHKELMNDSNSSPKRNVDRSSSSAKTPENSVLIVKTKDEVGLSKASQVAPQTDKSPAGSPQKRKYFLRGTLPVKSPTNKKEKSAIKDTNGVSPKITTDSSDSPAGKKTVRKSPAERRKSLRSSTKQQ